MTVVIGLAAAPAVLAAVGLRVHVATLRRRLAATRAELADQRQTAEEYARGLDYMGAVFEGLGVDEARTRVKEEAFFRRLEREMRK